MTLLGARALLALVLLDIEIWVAILILRRWK